MHRERGENNRGEASTFEHVHRTAQFSFRLCGAYNSLAQRTSRELKY